MMPSQRRSGDMNLQSAKVTANWPTNLLPSSPDTDSINRCATLAWNCTKIEAWRGERRQPACSAAILAAGPMGILPVDLSRTATSQDGARPTPPPNYLATLADGLMFKYTL